MVSPQLGHLAKDVHHKLDRNEFALVSILPFILNGIFGIMGHNPANKFRYPQEILEKNQGMVAFNMVNMANAVTPTAPKEQCMGLQIQLGLWIGSDDELFIGEKVKEYAQLAGEGVILDGETHSGILVNIHASIGPWIERERVQPNNRVRERERRIRSYVS